MTERFEPEQSALLPETRRLLSKVEQETGRQINIRPEQAIRGRGRAIYVVSDPNPDQHLVLFDPAESRFLDHLVAHESGHILRFHRAEPQERVVPVLTGERRSRALRQLLPDIQTLVKRGIPEAAIAEVYSIWLSGTIAQLSDTPADIRIERWIWRDFPDLRQAQEASLRHQVKTLQLVASPAVQTVTPKSVWRASNAMNYALVRAISELFSDKTLLRPYAGSWAMSAGDELYRMVDESPDLGLADDRRLSNLWAERLGFRGWYEWRRLDELPKGFRHAWE